MKPDFSQTHSKMKVLYNHFCTAYSKQYQRNVLLSSFTCRTVTLSVTCYALLTWVSVIWLFSFFLDYITVVRLYIYYVHDCWMYPLWIRCIWYFFFPQGSSRFLLCPFSFVWVSYQAPKAGCWECLLLKDKVIFKSSNRGKT